MPSIERSKNNIQLERRSEPPEQSVWWSKLTLAQKFSASSLGKFGYELKFIRKKKGKPIAVLVCNQGVAIVSYDGEINTSPTITLRK